jgi:site-specific DNA recombinase
MTFPRHSPQLQNNIEGAYEDKLQGHISEDFWLQKSGEWREEQHQLRAKIELHQKANENYIKAGCGVLELASRVSEIWAGRSPKSRRELLNIVQSNLLFDGTRLTATYAKPFCWLAEGHESSFWLPLLDSFRNWMNTEECRELAAAV